MRRFTEMRFFHLPDNISRSNADLPLLQNIYDEFTTSLFITSEKTNDLTAFYNQLCFARTELRSLRKDVQIKQINQYVPVKKFYNKALELVDAQLKLVTLKIGNSNFNLTDQEKPVRTKTKIKWSGTIYELVELGYAILATKSVNNGEVDIKELMEFLCNVFDFNIEMRKFYHAYTTFRKRGGDRTIFLNRLKEKLMDKMERDDNRNLKRH